MSPTRLGRMIVHKVHEKDSPVPLLSQLPGTTRQDLARLRSWYDQPYLQNLAAARFRPADILTRFAGPIQFIQAQDSTSWDYSI